MVTSDFVYIRLIGDRSIHERDFGSVQIDRIQEMTKWTDRLKEIQKYERDVKMGMVAANNRPGGRRKHLSEVEDNPRIAGAVGLWRARILRLSAALSSHLHLSAYVRPAAQT